MVIFSTRDLGYTETSFLKMGTKVLGRFGKVFTIIGLVFCQNEWGMPQDHSVKRLAYKASIHIE